MENQNVKHKARIVDCLSQRGDFFKYSIMLDTGESIIRLSNWIPPGFELGKCFSIIDNIKLDFINEIAKWTDCKLMTDEDIIKIYK